MVEDEPDWKCCQKLMANPKEFVLQVEALGRDKAPDEKALWEVRKMVAAQECFTVEEMGKKSMAAACIVQKVLQVLADADVVAAAAAA
jgi:ribosomal protein S25